MNKMSGDEILFKEVMEEDLEALNDIVNDPEVSRYLDLIPPVPLSKTIGFWEFARSRGALWWCIVLDGEIIGSVGIIPEDSECRMSHVGILFIYIMKKYWGRGYGNAAIDYALFEAGIAGLKRIEFIVSEENRNALALYNSKGFLREGVKRKAFFNGQDYTDLIIMARLL